MTTDTPSSRPKFRFWDDDYEQLAELSDGYVLVAHPSGPAICNGVHISTLDQHDDDSPALLRVKRDAWRRFHELTWEHIKGRFTYPGWANKP